jgi:hypothetical protein
MFLCCHFGLEKTVFEWTPPRACISSTACGTVVSDCRSGEMADAQDLKFRFGRLRWDSVGCSNDHETTVFIG